mgnify:CR=1 FL=1
MGHEGFIFVLAPDGRIKAFGHPCFRRQFNLSQRARLHTSGDQKFGEHIQTRTIHRIGDQSLATQVFGLNEFL